MGVTKENVEASLKAKLNPSHLSQENDSVVKMGNGWNLELMKMEWEGEKWSSPTGEWVCSSIGREWEWKCPKNSNCTLQMMMIVDRYEVVDTSGGCGASFVVEIVSEQFEGKRLLERHRMVNAALEEELKEIHALSIKKTVTPEQWKQQQEANQSNAAA
ncbi:hypothetical protein LR48_Vigan01g017000 [Vigna angularis]|uniref:BolA-like protein n=1 Tax=Phaseolus angularis TaxID=3914 RepID=A0A0L9TJG7_PHAAN|nr:hypothetical protein LR48_Vigan01g017000 [Vigna angularis]